MLFVAKKIQKIYFLNELISQKVKLTNLISKFIFNLKLIPIVRLST
jgi:hypothetical protein